MALKKDEYSAILDLSAQDERVIKYLKGETITIQDLQYNEKISWQLVCVNGYPLGWGKCNGATLKNKYFAGWRWM